VLPGVPPQLSPPRLPRRPPARSPSAAAVHLHDVLALLALDGAAPVKLAAAPLHQLRLGRAEAPAAAQELAAIHGRECPVALAARCAEDPAPGVPVAEVWAVQQVDQVMSCVGLEVRALGDQELAGNDHHPLELFLEDVAHLAEGRHDLPARVHLAGAQHTVAPCVSLTDAVLGAAVPSAFSPATLTTARPRW